MDIVDLSLEQIHVYVCLFKTNKWVFKTKKITDRHGRLTMTFDDMKLPLGTHSVRCIVQGDHSFVNLYLSIVPPKTQIVVFSVDGSLTKSFSVCSYLKKKIFLLKVTGRDPRIRPGAVDVVRFWQQQGYVILYATARPDMQQRLVASWLSQHHFPHGLLIFTPSFLTDLLK